MTANTCAPGDHGFLQAGLFLKEGDLGIILFESEGVGRLKGLLCLLEAIWISEEGDAIADLHEEVVITVGANVMILPEVQGMNQLSAVGALGPEVVGDRILLLVAATEFRLVKDTHGGSAKS